MGSFGARLTEVKQPVNYVGYIQSSGTQYIDAEFKPNNNTKVVMDFEVTGLPTDYSAVFSARNTTSGAGAFSFWVVKNGPQFLWQFNTGNGKGTSANAPSVVGNRLTAENTGSVMTVGGYTLSEAAATFATSYSLYLLATNDPDTTKRYCCKAKIYSCQIYDNGVLVRDMWPCYDPDGVACMYDKVEQKYYYNAGTGEFTAG